MISIFLMGCALSILANVVMPRRPLLRQLFADVPDDRKVHSVSVTRLGGLGLAVAMLGSFLGHWLFGQDTAQGFSGAIPGAVKALGLGAGLFFGIGLVDDIHRLSAKIKLLCQVLVSALVWVMGLQIGVLEGHAFSAILSLVATVSFLVLVVNAFNLIDGLDGLASGVFVIVMAFMVGMDLLPSSLRFFAVTLMAVVLGFMTCNATKRYKVFLGDSGAYLLGFVIAGFGILALEPSNAAAEPMSIALLLVYPILDVCLAIVRRIQAFVEDGQDKGENPLKLGLALVKCLARPDRQHLHHRLFAFFGHRTPFAVLTVYVYAIMGGLVSLGTHVLPGSTHFALVTSFGLVTMVLLFFLGEDERQRELDRQNAQRRSGLDIPFGKASSF